MNQNYNNPFFIFDITGLTEVSAFPPAFSSQFLKEYPTAREAVLFAKAGGAVICREVKSEGDSYGYGVVKLTGVLVRVNGKISLSFSHPFNPEEPNFNIEYSAGGGESGGGESGGGAN